MEKHGSWKGKGKKEVAEASQCEPKVEIEYSRMSTILPKGKLTEEMEVLQCKVKMPGAPQKDATWMCVEEENEYWFNRMRTIWHQNILFAYTITKSKLRDDVHVYELHTEPISGKMECYLDREMCSFVHRASHTVPNWKLSTIIRQYIDALDFLHRLDFYHGNFSIYKDFYFMEEEDLVVAKVADWHALGRDLGRLSFEIGLICPHLFCGRIDRLSKYLEGVTHEKLGVVKEEALRLSFFATRNDRLMFVLTRLPRCLKDVDFQNKVMTRLKRVQWDSYFIKHNHKDLIETMDKFKNEEIEGKPWSPKYDKSCAVSYSRFISAIYTHCYELKFQISSIKIMHWSDIDNLVLKADPTLISHLMEIDDELSDSRQKKAAAQI